MLHSGDLDFSFSGLKTAVLTKVREIGEPDDAAARRHRPRLSGRHRRSAGQEVDARRERTAA
jgi:tRNA A37 threonylcarbamoyltransferase TsaD